MKKIWIPLVLLAVMMGVTGCMINRTSFQEEAVCVKEKDQRKQADDSRSHLHQRDQRPIPCHLFQTRIQGQ